MAESTSEDTPEQAKPKTILRFGRDIHIHIDKPLERFNSGDVKAYKAYDDRDKSKNLVVLVSGIAQFPRWREEKIYMGLADPSFLRLLGTGVLPWPGDGVQKYVFLYQADVGECLVPAGGFSKTTWRHPDILEFLVHPIARMLREMHGRSFCHGAIRPDNIFYAAGDQKQPVILGDCLSSSAMSAQSALLLPIDRAMAEPFARGQGSSADDVYAFGVSMAMFLRRGNELSGMSDDEIVRRKVEIGSYATIIGGERFQASFMEFLRGVLHDDANLRWSVEDIFSWLDGTRLTPASQPKRKKAARPLHFMNQKYYFMDSLAMDFHKSPNALAEIVSNGELAQWIEKSLSDKQLHEQYSKTVESIGDVGAKADLLVTHMRMLFHPHLPIYYKGHCFAYDGLGGLLALMAYEERDLGVGVEILTQSLCDAALYEKGLSHNEVVALVKSYDRCRASLKKKRLGDGIERCIYMLCPDAPCLSPNYRKFFIHNFKSALIAFEKLSAAGGQIALFLDRHAIAFFAEQSGTAMDRCLFDLNSGQKDKQIIGNLRFLSHMSRQSKNVQVDAIAAVFLDSLSGVYKIFKNKALRKQVEDAVKKAADAGDLVVMSSLLDDESTLEKDQKTFARAMGEYLALQREYDDYGRRLAHRKTYGVAQGRNVASIVSWGVSMVITVMVVVAFMSGYQIF